MKEQNITNFEIRVATPKLDDAIEYFEHHPNSQFERLSEALIEIRELINKPKPWKIESGA